MSKFLYRTSEAKAAIGCGTTRLYELINDGTLDARRLGNRTYITAESLEAFVASLTRVLTPTMLRAAQERSCHKKRRVRAQEVEPGAVE